LLRLAHYAVFLLFLLEEPFQPQFVTCAAEISHGFFLLVKIKAKAELRLAGYRSPVINSQLLVAGC